MLVIARGRSAFSARNPEAIPNRRMRLLRRAAALLAMTMAEVILTNRSRLKFQYLGVRVEESHSLLLSLG